MDLKTDTVNYLRLVNDQSVVHSILLIGKARVSPLKYLSRPRLDLVAATLYVKIELLLKEELEYFWTDFKVVHGYISNCSKMFNIFVTSRIQFTCVTQICTVAHVPTAYNPVDDSSRGLDAIKSSELQR